MRVFLFIFLLITLISSKELICKDTKIINLNLEKNLFEGALEPNTTSEYSYLALYKLCSELQIQLHKYIDDNPHFVYVEDRNIYFVDDREQYYCTISGCSYVQDIHYDVMFYEMFKYKISPKREPSCLLYKDSYTIITPSLRISSVSLHDYSKTMHENYNYGYIITEGDFVYLTYDNDYTTGIYYNLETKESGFINEIQHSLITEKYLSGEVEIVNIENKTLFLNVILHYLISADYLQKFEYY